MSCLRTTAVIAAAVAGVLTALAVPAPGGAHAQTIRLGLSSEPSSLDPQFSRTGNNQVVADHLFDRLVHVDANNQPVPGLAVSWQSVDPLTWVVRLRPGVTFHDGKPFTAEDVVYSLDRIKTITGSPAPFTQNIGAIAKAEVVDPMTVRFTTKRPTPQFMEQAGRVHIVSKGAIDGAKAEDFTSGKAVVGTGPYRFASFSQGQSLTLTRNETYWGEKPAFTQATLRFVSNDASRVVALLAGELDIVDQVPPAMLDRVRADPNYTVHSIGSLRIVYFGVDSARDKSPFVTDLDGKPLETNPLRDPRVRLAISKMINRKAIVERLLAGSGEPAGQLVPEGLGGFAPDLKPVDFDPEGAKKLLAEAGWEKGFGLTVHASSDRIPRETEVAQAVGQMLNRGGIKVNGVVTQPYATYATAAGKQEFSFFLFSFGTTTADAAGGITAVLATFDKDTGRGAFNRARYSNPAFDALLTKALEEFDPTKRNALLADAQRVAFRDNGIIPLYWQVVHWAGRKDIAFTPSRTEDTLAMAARPAK
jgi:peptide/nickel transport system substrate-binding protein